MSSNEIEVPAIIESFGIDKYIYSALKSSIYPGAKDESIAMVVSYCKAAKLDVMQKPVHIVAMNVYDSQAREYSFRDVVMPGVGLYRIQASRTGLHVGTTEPEFGPLITKKLGEKEFTFPEWSRVIVKKLVGNVIAEFPAKEFWLENYANAGKDKITKQLKLEPNAMWAKRSFGQIAKCAEAQALRKAFPEFCSQPTAEEMEGKTLDSVEVEELVENITKQFGQLNKIDSIRDKLRTKTTKNTQEEKPIVDKKTILEKIEKADTLELLNDISEQAKSLDETDKGLVRKSFKNKQIQLMKEKETEKVSQDFFGDEEKGE
jgi:phage recombination protein Bet